MAGLVVAPPESDFPHTPYGTVTYGLVSMSAPTGVSRARGQPTGGTGRTLPHHTPDLPNFPEYPEPPAPEPKPSRTSRGHAATPPALSWTASDSAVRDLPEASRKEPHP
jgi:hypothetical protein